MKLQNYISPAGLLPCYTTISIFGAALRGFSLRRNDLPPLPLKILSFIMIWCFLSCPSRGLAQDRDSLLRRVRTLAFESKDYASASSLLRNVLQSAPGDAELLVFLGRLYLWNKQVDSARLTFAKTLSYDSSCIDAYGAFADLEYWEKNYDAALDLVQKGLAKDSLNTELMLRKAKILADKKEYKAALIVLDTLLRNSAGNADARALAVRIRDNASRNRVGVKYDYLYFNKQFPDPWHYLSIDYTRQTKAGAFTARVNYANRFSSNGMQYELEAYPVLSRTFYAYLNAAYSDDVGVFPKWKSGASLYANLPSGFEAEAGVRHLYFSNDAFILTVYLGKYFSNFLVGARTYLAPAKQNISSNYSVIARYYYGGPDDFVGLNAGFGISPDDRQLNIQLNEQHKLETYRGEIVLRRAVRKLNVILLNVSLTKQEYLPATTGLQFQGGVGYIRRF